MNEFNLIKIDGGKISEVANKFLDKVSEAVGGIARPHQIKRVAEAEVQAALIHANARIQISEIERRGLERMIREEGQKQENIENITQKAIPHLQDGAKPEELDRDWIAHFFDRCRLVSDDQMQELWSSILGDEANRPGTFSKKTIDTVATLEKHDAHLFSNFCSFIWVIGAPFPLIVDHNADVYNSKGITFSNLEHLASIGLISFTTLSDYTTGEEFEDVDLFYCGRRVSLKFPGKKKLQLGKALLTRTGRELFAVCSPLGSEEFLEYMLDRWINAGIHVSVSVENRRSWESTDWAVQG